MSPSTSGRRTYVIDTSVLLSDPQALRRFAEHDVVVPVVVITELEAKRHHAELGYFARTALRHFDDLRIRFGQLDTPIPINDAGGTMHVELNHADQAALPDGFRLGDNDSRILAVALNFAAEGCDVTLISKDLPMRVKASAVGLAAEEYRAELAIDTEWRGMAELDVERAQLDEFYETGTLDLEQARQLPCHTGVVLLSSNGSAQGRVSRPSRCAPVWRRWSSGTSTPRWWCSARSTPSVDRNSAICPAPRAKKWRPGPRLSSTRW